MWLERVWTRENIIFFKTVKSRCYHYIIVIFTARRRIVCYIYIIYFVYITHRIINTLVGCPAIYIYNLYVWVYNIQRVCDVYSDNLMTHSWTITSATHPRGFSVLIHLYTYYIIYYYIYFYVHDIIDSNIIPTGTCTAALGC